MNKEKIKGSGSLFFSFYKTDEHMNRADQMKMFRLYYSCIQLIDCLQAKEIK